MHKNVAILCNCDMDFLLSEYESTLLERQLLLYNLPPSTSRDQLMTLSDNISTIRLEYYWNSPLASEGFRLVRNHVYKTILYGLYVIY